jgi:hypothetical protein
VFAIGLMFEKVNILRGTVIIVVVFVTVARRVIIYFLRPRSFGIYLIFRLKTSTYPVPETLLNSSSKHGTMGEIKRVNDLRGS